jgi:hypothetical protein
MEPEWLPEARDLRSRQVGYQRIASRVGASRQTVYYWLNRDVERARSLRRNPEQRAKRRDRQPPRRVRRTCEGCGVEFDVPRSRTMSGRASRFCTWDCWKARGVPRLRKASRKPSGWLLRESFSLKLKGEAECRVCAGTAEHLHHAIPRSMYRAGVLELLNGLPLCAACHMGWHRREVTIYRDVFTPGEWAWLTAQELLGQSVTAWLDDRYPPRASDEPRS